MGKGFTTLICAWVALCASARAETFTINPLQSILTLSGSVAGNPASQQPPAGFSTSYSGTIDATLSGMSIQFNSASAVAAISGNYSPLVGGGAGTAPGDYGGMFTVSGIFPGTFAIRGLEASLSSGPLSLTGGAFDASQLLFLATTGSVDYRVAALAMMGTLSVAGNSAMNGPGMGSIAIVGGVNTLTIPIDVTILFTVVTTNDTMFRLRGNLVATAVPEPATWMLLGFGILVCAQQFRRKG